MSSPPLITHVVRRTDELLSLAQQLVREVPDIAPLVAIIVDNYMETLTSLLNDFGGES